MSDVDIAWAAGLFEGEGCITFNKRQVSGNWYSDVRLCLRMTDRDVVEKFHWIMACGNITTIANPAHVAAGRKPAWDWRAGKRDDVDATLRKMLPHFGKRRRGKAREALAAIDALRLRKRGEIGTKTKGGNR